MIASTFRDRTFLTPYFSIISFFGTVAVACSLGEIASIYPTAGGKTPPLSADDISDIAKDNTTGSLAWLQRRALLLLHGSQGGSQLEAKQS